VALINPSGETAIVEVRISYSKDGVVTSENPWQYTLIWNEEISSWQIDS
jgi:hypothetical protein